MPALVNEASIHFLLLKFFETSAYRSRITQFEVVVIRIVFSDSKLQILTSLYCQITSPNERTHNTELSSGYDDLCVNKVGAKIDKFSSTECTMPSALVICYVALLFKKPLKNVLSDISQPPS
jgi:hypothetical protein